MSHSTFARPLRASLLILAALLLALLIAAPAQAAPRPPLGMQYTYPSHAGYDSDKEYIDSLVRLVDGVPRWSGRGSRPEINVSEYHLTMSNLVSALDRADARGATVRFLTFQRNGNDDPMSDSQVRALASKLKGSKSGSWVKVCRYSCRRGGTTGINHQKLWSFSSTGGRVNVVRSSSGNASGDTDTSAWNQWTDLSSRAIFGAARACIISSRADKTMGQCRGATSEDGRFRIDFSPRSSKADPVLSWLKDTRCHRGSQIRVPMWGVTIKAWVSQLDYMDHHGCDVRVIGNGSKWFGGDKDFKVGGRKVDALTFLARRGVVVYNASYLRNGRYAGGLYIHEKTVLRFNVDEASRRGVQHTSDMVSGSANGTPSGLRYNDDTMLWDESDAAVRQQIANFNVIAGRSLRVK